MAVRPHSPALAALPHRRLRRTTPNTTSGGAPRASTCGRTSSTTSGAWCATAPRRTSATAARARRRCTDSDRGREIVRPLDPWPHSEAGRFHRGLALMLVALALLWCWWWRSPATTRPPRRRCLAACWPRRSCAGRLAARARPPQPPGRTSRSQPVPRPAHGRAYKRGGRERWASRTGVVLGDRHRRVALIVSAAARCSASRILREYERAVVFRLGRLLPVQGPGLVMLLPAGRPDGPGRPADGHPHRSRPGGDHARQRPGARGGGVLLPRHRPGARRSPSRGLRAGDLADRPDHAALGARRRRARPAAGRARAPQRGPPADHRRADRALGHQGLDGRDQGRRDPRGDAARDGPPGRGRARAPGQGDQRRGRVPGGREARRRGRDHRREPSALQLRYLQTLLEMGADQNSTIVFPLPLDLLKPFLATPGAAARTLEERPASGAPESG